MVLENLSVGLLVLSKKYVEYASDYILPSRDVRTKTKQRSARLDFWKNAGGPACTRRKYQKGYGVLV